MSDWGELIPPAGEAFLPPDHPMVRTLGQPGERFLPPVDVVDWWEHSGSHARVGPAGIVGVERQLVITTSRIIVMSHGSIERSMPISGIGGAEVVDPPDRPTKGSERAVLVKSRSQSDIVLGCWSMPQRQADQLMSNIFKHAHGIT